MKKTLGLNPGKYVRSLGVLFLSFGGMRPTPAKTAMKAENHNKAGPINTHVGKSGQSPLIPSKQCHLVSYKRAHNFFSSKEAQRDWFILNHSFELPIKISKGIYQSDISITFSFTR